MQGLFIHRCVVWGIDFYDTLRTNAIAVGRVRDDGEFAELYLAHQHWLMGQLQ